MHLNVHRCSFEGMPVSKRRCVVQNSPDDFIREIVSIFCEAGLKILAPGSFNKAATMVYYLLASHTLHAGDNFDIACSLARTSVLRPTSILGDCPIRIDCKIMDQISGGSVVTFSSTLVSGFNKIPENIEAMEKMDDSDVQILSKAIADLRVYIAEDGFVQRIDPTFCSRSAAFIKQN